MAGLDAIWNRAREDLILDARQGAADEYLWEHSDRVARNARLIGRLPVVQAERPDELVIVAAALYHDAGWVAPVRSGDIDRLDVLTGPSPPGGHTRAAALLERSLADLLPSQALDRAARIVRHLGDRESGSIEAAVVAEANNLDGFGLPSLVAMVRRSLVEGRGAQAVVSKWRRQKEYQYWTAQLKEYFRFAPVRQLARRRLEDFEGFMVRLEEQHLGRDLEAVVKESNGMPTGRAAGK